MTAVPAPTPLSARGGARPRRGGSRLVGALMVALALAVLGAVLLQWDAITSAMSGRTDRPGGTSAGNGSNGGTAGGGLSANGGGADLGATTVPDAYGGAWRGQLYEAAGYTTDVVLTLPTGQSAGQIEYPSMGCTGTVQVTAVGSGDASLTMSEAIASDPQGNCPNGVITLTPGDSPATLSFHWRNADDPTAFEDGTVRRGPAPPSLSTS